ncbi:MAG: hypothetical protein K0Q55_3226 [Verrucomicrobia bacterium]|jgi:hypothetical protein|nr:hypothetical protein [Verrucomicrobiota bacterium]
MKHWRPYLFLALLACWLISLFDPFTERVKIHDGSQVPAVLRYQQEFADSIKITTHWNNGQPLHNPHFYLPGNYSTLDSPDGVHRLQWREKDYFHTLDITRPTMKSTATILNVEEGDPGSGKAYRGTWSADSQAVFVFGEGRLPGDKYSGQLSFIYLVSEKRLYQVDIQKNLAQRIAAPPH